MNKNINKKKNWLYQRHKRSDNLDYNMLNAITTDTLNAGSLSKLEYHKRLTKELHDPKTAAKT